MCGIFSKRGVWQLLCLARWCCIGLLCWSILCLSAWGMDDATVLQWQVKKIQFHGLHRVSSRTALSYFPIHEGDSWDASQASLTLRALYKTGFFDSVSLERQGGALIVNVVERPVLESIVASSHPTLDKEKWHAMLKEYGLLKGRVFDPYAAQRFKRALHAYYIKQSRYNVVIDMQIVRRTAEAVRLVIHIDEGTAVKVRRMTVLGHHALSLHDIYHAMDMAPTSLWTVFSKKDLFSKEKLQYALEKLRFAYADRGYLDFHVLEKKLHVTPDKKRVDVTLLLSEGKQYRLGTVTWETTLMEDWVETELKKQVTLFQGHAFSRSDLQKGQQAVETVLANHGYAFSHVRFVPALNASTAQVDVKIYIEPNGRTRIHRIRFAHHTKTADRVLRREMRQIEGEVFNLDKIKESKRRLANLGYLDDVNVQVLPVPNQKNAVDLLFSMKEASSASANMQFGYSDTDGFLYGLFFNQKNFMGTGQGVSIAFDHSQYARSYRFSYFNPYYTRTGISRGVYFFSKHVTPRQANLASYSMDLLGLGVNYRFPLGRYMHALSGFGYEQVHLHTDDQASDEIKGFVLNQGDRFDLFKMTLGWEYRSFDRAIFPTRGVRQLIRAEVGAPIGGNSLNYYKAVYHALWYVPLPRRFIISTRLDLGYGRGYGHTGTTLPFFNNFYAGGMGSVRGYEGNTLGPRDSRQHPLGGNVLTTASISLVLPPVFSPNLRTELFFDIGGVDQGRIAHLRDSVGITFKWRTPVAPIVFSFAKALNADASQRNKEFFQFTIGTAF